MSENETEQEELRREIERTRSELGETVEALSHKADVKTQAREKVERPSPRPGQGRAGQDPGAGQGA